MSCGKCQKQAAYTRKYSGETLCSECFSNSILHKAAKTISKHKMIRNNELVCVAVSGGKDSLVLLDVLNKMSKTHNFRLMAVTIECGIASQSGIHIIITSKISERYQMEI